MSQKKVFVNSKEDLQMAMTSYLGKGFVVASSTSDRTIMQKKKEFKILWAVIGFLLCGLPLLIYLIVYATQPDVEIVEICIDPNQIPTA